jgi:hypothetical protein
MSDAEIEALGENVGAMASLAGNGLPPIRTDPAPPQTPRLLRDAAFAAVLALLAAAVIAGGVAVYPHTSDANRERAGQVLLPGNQVVAESAAALEHAEKLDDLAEAGAAARAAMADVELLDTRGISDPHVRRAAGELLHGQLALLSALEPLTDLDEATVGRWRTHRRRIRAAVRRIEHARPAVAELHLTSRLNVWGPVLSWSLANADAVVATAARRLRVWRARVHEIRQRRGEALAAMTSYDSSVRGYLATDDGLRTDLDDWIRRIDTEGTTFARARRFLRGASAARRSVRDGIAALDVPPTLAAAHTRLLASIDRRVRAVRSDPPGWDRLRNELDVAARKSAAARLRWQEAIAAEVKRIEAIKRPKRPDV